jgi:AmmeMemoRadiSam system protein B/AmmeMemoRadiSam system protein A
MSRLPAPRQILVLPLLLLPIALASTPAPQSPAERAPAVAGKFYPAESQRLRAALGAYLEDALPASSDRPLALIAPHAGYHYSGQIAADAWQQAANHEYDVIVILGANHSAPAFHGVSVFLGAGYRTPLGLATIDRELSVALAASETDFAYRPEVHRAEHSVEVHVPFAQTLFPGVPIVTAVLGSDQLALCTRFGRSLAAALKGRRSLIVASSDLSHYPRHDDAVRADHTTLRAMARIDPAALVRTTERLMAERTAGLSTCACGRAPVLAASVASRALGATHGRVVSYANSGDVAIGDPQRVVGYGAVALLAGKGPPDTRALELPATVPADRPLTADERDAMLRFARMNIERWLESGTIPLARGFTPTLWRRQGVFVTLTKQGALRGCIGHMADDRPICEAVGAMALQAAFNDRRFTPVVAEELDEIEIEISLLSPLARIESAEAIEIGRDGVKLVKDGHSAVYLPEVPVEQGWDREETLRRLCIKAGLPADAWQQGAELYTFHTVIFGEEHDADSGS